MKIAVVIDAWYPIVGGSQTHVLELSLLLVKKYGCKIDIFTRALTEDEGLSYKEDEELLDGHLRLIRVKPTSKLNCCWGRTITIGTIAIKLIRENRRENYDLIHAHSILGGLTGKIAAIFIKKPILFTVHGSPKMGLQIKNFEYLIEKVIHTKIRYDQVITVGKGFLEYLNINKNITIIPNGVSINKFDAVKGPMETDFFKVIFVGRLDKIKGIDTLIEAVNILKIEHRATLVEKKFKLHLVGYGFNENQIRKKISNYCLDEFIVFCGKITGDKLIHAYKSSHLFVLPSLSEGQPITFLEAMASRLPILTTYSADNSNIIDPTIGWKVKEQDSKAIACKFLEIMKLPKCELEIMGERGYRKVSKNYTWDIIAEKTFYIYKTLEKI